MTLTNQPQIKCSKKRVWAIHLLTDKLDSIEASREVEAKPQQTNRQTQKPRYHHKRCPTKRKSCNWRIQLVSTKSDQQAETLLSKAFHKLRKHDNKRHSTRSNVFLRRVYCSYNHRCKRTKYIFWVCSYFLCLCLCLCLSHEWKIKLILPNDVLLPSFLNFTFPSAFSSELGLWLENLVANELMKVKLLPQEDHEASCF